MAIYPPTITTKSIVSMRLHVPSIYPSLPALPPCLYSSLCSSVPRCLSDCLSGRLSVSARIICTLEFYIAHVYVLFPFPSFIPSPSLKSQVQVSRAAYPESPPAPARPLVLSHVPCPMSVIAPRPAPAPTPYGPLDEGLLYAVLYSNIVLFSLPESGSSRLVSLARCVRACVRACVSAWVPLYTSSVPLYAL